MVSKQFLMCKPTYFSVDYVINPWMTREESVHSLLAERQWNDLYTHLKEYAEVKLIDPVLGLPDFVFTANAGFVLDHEFIPTHFKHKERQREEEYFKQWFKAENYSQKNIPEGMVFEGGGDVCPQLQRDFIWMGYNIRTSLDAKAYLERYSSRPVWPLKLIDPHFYHLDTCLCPLLQGALMYYPPAFDAASNDCIQQHIPESKRIIVDSQDAACFACNAVVIETDRLPDKQGVIFISVVSMSLQERLNELGYEVILQPVSEFKKAGGAVRCLTLEI